MSASKKSIFLSCASQDVEAARRICEALRAAGFEVWYDESELRDGDASAEHFADHFLADCALMQGDFATAAAHYACSLQAAVRSGDRIETCFELQGVAMASAGLGHSERACDEALSRRDWSLAAAT